MDSDPKQGDCISEEDILNRILDAMVMDKPVDFSELFSTDDNGYIIGFPKFLLYSERMTEVYYQGREIYSLDKEKNRVHIKMVIKCIQDDLIKVFSENPLEKALSIYEFQSEILREYLQLFSEFGQASYENQQRVKSILKKL